MPKTKPNTGRNIVDVLYNPATCQEDEANARLVAAAPELLAALDCLLEQTVDMDLKHGIELTKGEQEARTMALNAITKAKGEK